MAPSTPGPNSSRTQDTKTMIVNETGTLAASSSSPINGIPSEVNKIIEQDLAKNPLPPGAERLYRVVINRNLTSPSEDAQVVRVVVKSQPGAQHPTTSTTMTTHSQTTPPYRSQSVMVPQAPLIVQQPSVQQIQSSPQQVHYILPPIEQVVQHEQLVAQQPHRYTPPPHKSVILPSANVSTSPMRSTHENDVPKKSAKKKFSFFG